MIDPGTPEAIFAQKLASCDSKVRKKALNRLRTWIRGRIKSENYFNETDMMKLWKGLYYCFWMQDKPLLQEELSQSLCDLISSFDNLDQKFLFMDTFFLTLSREWYAIDRWRMDKFMMLVRIFVRTWLLWLKQKKWKTKIVQRTLDTWKKTVMFPDDTKSPAGLKYHFASIYLDELDNAGKMDLDQDNINGFLAPYLALLREKTLSDAFFDTIQKEIFETILLSVSEEGEVDGDGEEAETSGIKFDFAKLASEFFEIGKDRNTTGDRRKKLYGFVRRFRLAAKKQDPFEEYESDLGSDIDENVIESAAKKFVRRKMVDKNEKKQARKEIRKRAFAGSDISGEEDSEKEVAEVTVQKKIRKKLKHEKR